MAAASDATLRGESLVKAVVCREIVADGELIAHHCTVAPLLSHLSFEDAG
jgi:hypothetical protein